MAEQTVHDVVKQPRSADAPSSADDSATKTFDPAVRAAAANIVSTDRNSNLSNLPLDEKIRAGSQHNTGAVDLELSASQEEVTDSPIVTDPVNQADVNQTYDEGSESRDIEVNENGSFRSTGVDGSTDSDTETSKLEGIEAAGKDIDGRDQIPRYSVKKVAGFKPVSVTKNFLAKAGSVSTTVKSSSDKVNNSTSSTSSAINQAAARPRLVAKTASGHRSVTPKSLNMTSKNGRNAGPDPNQVWNRNRVSTPQATPKHLTDEELRQQYGIQLASRPQEGGDGNEAKWADIDDDEDDWAPETIEWNDGTKINLAQADNIGGAEQQLAAMNDNKVNDAAEHAKSKAPAMKLTTVGPNATVLKLGSALQPKATGLVLKNSSEKPTLVAKPSTSTPVKSPWAAIPPIDKISPVPINPPPQQSQPRFGQKDPHGFDAMPPPLTPQAKEIAADDFSRFSRESGNAVPRELFNSQSGRYEPVSENRRQVARKEQNFRQPSVLQRPPPGDHGPAEPSPAFQTHRSQQEPGSFGRRRTSSTVSGESGRLGRRMSFNRGFDGTRTTGEVLRRDSQHEPLPPTPSLSSARPSQRDESPAFSQSQSINSQSPTVTPAQTTMSNGHQEHAPQNETPTPLPSTGEDPVVVQKRLMREKREAAIKRRREEDEKEKAERMERIRLRMETLGLTDEKMGKKVVVIDSEPSPKVLLKDSKEAGPATPQSPPKPPIPKISGQPQQYGLMTLHAPQTVTAPSALVAAGERKSPDPPQKVEAKAAPQSESPLPQVNGDVKKAPREVEQGRPVDAMHKESVGEIRPQPWSSVQQAPGGYPKWNNNNMANHPPSASSLWGPPDHNKAALGNGDFHNNIPMNSLRQAQPPYSQQLVSTQPPPIGTPRQSQLRVAPSVDKPFETVPRSLAEDSQTIPAFPPETITSPANYTRHQLSNLAPSIEPKHPSVTPMGVNTTAPPSSVDRPAALSAWASFGANPAKHDAELHNRIKQEHDARLAEQQLAGLDTTLHFNPIQETWKPIKSSGNAGSRRVVKNTETQRELPDEHEHAKASTQAPTTQPVRSRYQDIFDQSHHVASSTLAIVRPSSPMGPPPDSPNHPVYHSTSQRPLVNLPGSKPKVDLPEKPVVRLPPAKSGQISGHASTTSEPRAIVSPVRGGPQSLAMKATWQDKFNGLFDRKPSPEKKFVEVVDFSISKVPLELTHVGQSTPVTLPPQQEPESVAMEPQMKCVEDEDALFEERDFGSVPITRIPARVPIPAWNPAGEPFVTFKRAKAMILKDQDIFSSPVFIPGHEELVRSSGVPITISIQGMASPRTRVMPQPVGFIPPRSGHAQSAKGKPRHAPKNRDSASPHGSSGSHTNKPNNRSASSGGGLPKPRPKHNNAPSWARRVSGVA